MRQRRSHIPVLYRDTLFARDETAATVWGDWFFDAAPPSGGTDGYIAVWTGSAWAYKPVKVWTGSAWVQKPLKRWNGSAWVLSNGA